MNTHHDKNPTGGTTLLVNAAAPAAGRDERQVHPLNGIRQAIGGILALIVRIFRQAGPKVPSADQAPGTNEAERRLERG